MQADSSNAPVNVAIPFAGNWAGWRNARIELVVSGANGTATLAVGYFKISKSKTMNYDEWNALR